MKLVIIVIALVFAVVASVMVSGVFKEQKVQPTTNLAPAPVQEEVKAQIYVAKNDIPIGARIKQDDVEVKQWPANLLPPGAIQAGTQVESQIASGPISKGEPLMASKLRNPNDPSYISGQLPEGMRAITISVGVTDSVAGFVAPGDLVDVLFTFDLNKAAAEGGDIKSASGGAQTDRIGVAENLLSGIKVLAVDKRVTSGAAPVQNGQQQAEPPYPASITLAVNQRDAQKVRLAERVGKLSLVLRSLADANSVKRPRPTLEQDLTRLMPPAYFPVLFNSDQDYTSEEVDLFSGKGSGKKDGEVAAQPPEKIQVNIYRGTTLESKEIKVQ